MNTDNLLSLFHHVHHDEDGHSVHHCGGAHAAIEPKLDYTIVHCTCGKHNINKQVAIGHASNCHLDLVEVSVTFMDECPQSGWHVESGIINR